MFYLIKVTEEVLYELVASFCPPFCLCLLVATRNFCGSGVINFSLTTLFEKVHME